MAPTPSTVESMQNPMQPSGMQLYTPPARIVERSSTPPAFPRPDSIKSVMSLDRILGNPGPPSSSSAAPSVDNNGPPSDDVDGIYRERTPDSANTPMSMPAATNDTDDAGNSSSDYQPSSAASEHTPQQIIVQHEDNAADANEPDLDNKDGGSPDAPEFYCCFSDPDVCRLGQYLLSLSRKMVSDFFGRNKKETSMVDEATWIRACRKHYQRQSYQNTWAAWKAEVVNEQLERIDQQEPGVRYNVVLKSSEMKRLTDYYANCSAAGQAFDPRADAATLTNTQKPEQSSIAVLHEIHQLCGKNKTKNECRALVNTARDMVDQERCLRLPAFEMLPQFAALKAKRSSKRTNTSRDPPGGSSGKGKKNLPAKRKGGSGGGNSRQTKRQKV